MGGTLFWVSGGEWGCMGHYFGWVRVGGSFVGGGGGGGYIFGVGEGG